MRLLKIGLGALSLVKGYLLPYILYLSICVAAVILFAVGMQFKSYLSYFKKQLIKKTIVSPPDPNFIARKIMEFNRGFGNITYEGGLVTAASVRAKAIAKSKNYNFNPTILPKEQFQEYLTILKNAERPLRERFVLTGEHWRSGDISIDQDGNVKVLFIDSVGFDNRLINIFSDFFKIFPNATAYLDDTQRQHSQYGCSVFTLDDIRHLFSIENNLGNKGKKVNLFDYLDNHKCGKMPFNHYTINLTQLPASFMRTKQSRALIEDVVQVLPTGEERVVVAVLPKRNPDEILNKKGQTVKQFLEVETSDSPVNYYIHPETGGKRNRRLEYKLKKIAENNHKHITNLSEQQLRDEMQQFTLEGLKQRLAKESYATAKEASVIPESYTLPHLKKQASIPSEELDFILEGSNMYIIKGQGKAKVPFNWLESAEVQQMDYVEERPIPRALTK